MDKFIEKITIQDSYFYAEMVIYDIADATDTFNQKLGIVIKMNLYNSKEFHMSMMENTPRKTLRGKQII